MGKSTCITYLLWLIGGWVGLHLFYLRRDKHALVWFMSAGGCFGLGCLRDLCRIPDYVAEANQDDEYTKDFERHHAYRKKPPFQAIRFFGAVFVGCLLAFVIRGAMPDMLIDFLKADYYIGWILLESFVPLACAIGVYLVFNIGNQMGCFKYCVAGAYLIFPIYLQNTDYLTHMAFACATAVNWKGRTWRVKPEPKKHICKRLVVMFLCITVYSSLWTSMIVFNCHVTTQDGDKILVKDALHNFFTSPAWENTKDTFWKIYQHVKVNGWSTLYQELMASLDPEGEANAYKVLDVPPGTSEKEISSKYKKLVKEWHPDKFQNKPDMKEEAQKRFIEIQQAYEKLSTIKTRRARKNQKQDFEKPRTHL